MGAALMSGWTNSGVGVDVDTVAVVRDIEKTPAPGGIPRY